MLKIGDFSTLSRISIHMLRHYNGIGLLIPAHVDEFTGYRYYSEEQLPVANRIQALKSMGLSLGIIKDILTEYDDADSLEKYLTILAAQKKEEIKTMEKQLLLINNTIKSLAKRSHLPNCSIAVKEIPKRNVVSFRETISTYNCEGILWSKLAEETASQNIQYASPRYDIAIFHDEGYREDEIDVEVQRSVVGIYEDTENLKFKAVGSIIAATLTFKGAYDWLQEANEALANWMPANNYMFDPPMFNIYHISPETEAASDKMITEVCFPIKKK